MIYIDLDEIRGREDLILHSSFPRRSIEYASRILDDLRSIGVESIAFIEAGGRLEPLMLGKGYRGLVLRGRLGGWDAALKILRTDSTVPSLRGEAEATLIANRADVGPKVLGFTENIIEGFEKNYALEGYSGFLELYQPLPVLLNSLLQRL
jgi:hypothetical protein